MNSSLQPSPLFSPSQLRPQTIPNKDWNFVDSWLRGKLGGKSAPPFERNTETLKTLAVLAAWNEAADEEIELLEKLKRKSLAEFKADSLSTTPLLQSLLENLTEPGRQALHTLAASSQALQNPTCSSVALARSITNQTLYSLLLAQQHSRVSALQSTLHSQLLELRTMLSHINASDFGLTGKELMKLTADRKDATDAITPKLHEYKLRVDNFSDHVAVTVPDLVQQEHELKEIRDRVKGVENKVKFFNDLPTERRQARAELERARTTLMKLEAQRDELFEGLVEGKK